MHFIQGFSFVTLFPRDDIAAIYLEGCQHCIDYDYQTFNDLFFLYGFYTYKAESSVDKKKNLILTELYFC